MKRPITFIVSKFTATTHYVVDMDTNEVLGHIKERKADAGDIQFSISLNEGRQKYGTFLDMSAAQSFCFKTLQRQCPNCLGDCDGTI